MAVTVSDMTTISARIAGVAGSQLHVHALARAREQARELGAEGECEQQRGERVGDVERQRCAGDRQERRGRVDAGEGEGVEVHNLLCQKRRHGAREREREAADPSAG